ncbi:MAG TPA: hypothetical protein DEB39_00380 [Planctomycetaceae bacterium]|nr:hypothetical protein [Planctomycetaceae bacterium]
MTHRTWFACLLVSLAVPVVFFPWADLGADPWAKAQPGTGSTPVESVSNQLRTRVDLFFNELDTASSSSMPFEKLLLGGPLEGSGTSESVDSLKSHFETVKKQFGPYFGYELIDEKSVGRNPDLVLMRYLYKCEKHPVVWYFTFYRRPSAPNNWVIVDVRFDTNLAVLML